MALHILRRAYETGQIQPGDPIAEATSGNTGISFAAIGRALGHPVTVFMPDWMSSERISLIASFGASVVLVSKADGGFLGSIARADAMKESNPRTFLPHQFSNEANIDAHFTGTGPEIWLQLQGQALSTDLLRSEPAKDGYLTPQVEMLGFDSVNRVCDMCADPRI